MRQGFLDIGVNWVEWLRAQAARHYIWDARAQYFRVNAPRGQTTPLLRDVWQKLPEQQKTFPNLKHNLFFRLLPHLSLSTRTNISNFFSARGLRDFEFLDHGGRAIVFRARHVPTGQMRIARMEAPHRHRYPRPDHPVILQTFASNEGRFQPYGDIKLEILSEIMPLNKMWKAYDAGELPLVREAFYRAVWFMAWGTNMMYGPDMYDRDCEMTNTGVRPDGRVVSFDPQIVTGPLAHEEHRHYKTPPLLQDANAQQLALIYPTKRNP